MKKLQLLCLSIFLGGTLLTSAQMVDIRDIVPDTSNACGKPIGITVSGYLSYWNTFTFEGDTSWISGDTVYCIIEYSWWTGMGFPSLQAFSFHYNFPAIPKGSYTVNATTIYNKNLSDDSIATFNQGTGIDASITLSDKYPCVGETITVENLSQSTKKYWYRNGLIVDSSNTYSFSETASGNVDLMLKVIDGACYDSLSEVVRVQEMPVVDLGNDTTLCIGDTLHINAFDPKARWYEWNDGSRDRERDITESGTYILQVNHNHCSAEDTIVVDFENCTVGINENTDEEISVFYSPEGLLKIRSNESLQRASILDLQGRLIGQWNLNSVNSVNIQVNELNPGMHVLMINTDQDVQTFKFMKY